MKRCFFVIVIVLFFAVAVQASPFVKLWEKSFEDNLPNGYDVNSKGEFGFVSQGMVVILDKGGSTILNKPNTSKDWIIEMSDINFLLQNGGDGQPSSARVYDYKGNVVWQVKADTKLGIAEMSPKGNYIVFSDANWGDFRLYDISGKMLTKKAYGAVKIVFDNEEKIVSALGVGIFRLEKDQVEDIFNNKAIGYYPDDSFLVDHGKKILLVDRRESVNLKMYDTNLQLIWSKPVNDSMSITVFNDLIFVYDAKSINVFNINGEKLGEYIETKDNISQILWGSKELGYMIVLTFKPNTIDFQTKYVTITGKTIYQQEIGLSDRFIFNEDHNLMYVFKKGINNFTLVCYQL